jgi:hypothetical protein
MENIHERLAKVKSEELLNRFRSHIEKTVSSNNSVALVFKKY